MPKHFAGMASLLAVSGLLVLTTDIQALPTLQESCKDDVAKFCPDASGAEGRILTCLVKHQMEELSLDCRALLQGPEASYLACEADIARFCARVQPGQGRVLDCLDAHKQRLSKPCRSVVKIAMQNPVGKAK